MTALEDATTVMGRAALDVADGALEDEEGREEEEGEVE